MILLLHLAPDGIGSLGAPDDFGLDTCSCQLNTHVPRDPVDHITTLFLQHDKAAHDGFAAIRVEHLERQILQLFPHPMHPHATRKRGIDIHRLPRFLRLFFGAHCFDRAHIVQPVGQLDQNDTQIFGHRHEELAEVFGLLGLKAGQLDVGQLGDPVHQHRHLFAKARCDL